MTTLNRFQPVIIIATAGLGILLGLLPEVGEIGSKLIEPALMLLLFFVFLSIDFSKFEDAVKNIKLTGISLIINFIWTPIFAMVLAKVFLGVSIDLQIGFIMLLVTPCTDWYLVFTKMSRGNLEASTALLPLNLILQVLLLLVYLFLFTGSNVTFDAVSILYNMVIVLVIPFICARLVRLIAKKRGKLYSLSGALEDKGDAFQLLFLCLAVCAMFASQGELVLANLEVFLLLFIPLIVFFVVIFFIDMVVGRLAKFSRADKVSLIFTTLARNSPLALAIAVSVFSDRPLIALALVIGPLIELPILSLISSIINRLHEAKGA